MPGVTGLQPGLVDPRMALAPNHACEKTRRAAAERLASENRRVDAEPRVAVRRDDQTRPLEAHRPRLLLLVVLIVIEVFVLVVIVAVGVGMSCRAMGLVDLVVPQLAIGAILGEQLGMGTALDRPAP